jgi:hypothetical protein
MAALAAPPLLQLGLGLMGSPEDDRLMETMRMIDGVCADFIARGLIVVHAGDSPADHCMVTDPTLVSRFGEPGHCGMVLPCPVHHECVGPACKVELCTFNSPPARAPGGEP